MIWNLLIFWITIQTFQDINFTNQTCARNKPKYYILPHLFYTNAKIIMHIKYALKTHLAIHLHLLHKTHLIHVLFTSNYQPSQIKQWNMLLKLCVYNYVASHKLINWASKTFEGYEWKSSKVYHLGWKGPNPYCNPFFPYILILIKSNESKSVKYFINTIF